MILHFKMLIFILILIWREYFHMTKIIRARNVKIGPGLGFLVLNPRCWILGAGFWVSILILVFYHGSRVLSPRFSFLGLRSRSSQ